MYMYLLRAPKYLGLKIPQINTRTLNYPLIVEDICLLHADYIVAISFMIRFPSTYMYTCSLMPKFQSLEGFFF